jgi:hypothetical protein
MTGMFYVEGLPHKSLVDIMPPRFRITQLGGMVMLQKCGLITPWRLGGILRHNNELGADVKSKEEVDSAKG